MNSSSALSVSQLNLYVKSLLEGDRNLKSVWLRGELSNFVRNARSGHCYFSVKDPTSSLKAVMFSRSAASLTFVPRDGQQVLLHGRISLYERDGQYQFYVDQMLPDGLGQAYLEFLRLKNLLESEGLFDRKKPLPDYPRQIGVCTSPTGAALQDILSVCRRLAPGIGICVYPCQMQGEEAPASVLEGLRYFQEKKSVDLVIVARGGGSYEDLAVFNHEGLARFAAEYPLPLISAVGHEIDFTILDFASDFRAATPSVAAEVAVGKVPALSERLLSVTRSIRASVDSRLRLEQERLSGLIRRTDLSHLLEGKEQALDFAYSRIMSSFQRYADKSFSDFSRLTARLSALNPLSVLERGFTVAETEGKILRRVDDVEIGARFNLNFQDGVIFCAAESKRKRKL